ncbi:hypothetical protein [Clostridium sp. UBA6640]|uniref:hypothetical protein n=1 Tax=Clostridium sp. UBA6640 TaxID=1946370 RepID=UPI0025C01A34|nr:hypothetical protein [Clostridium sp. UBA6640]
MNIRGIDLNLNLNNYTKFGHKYNDDTKKLNDNDEHNSKSLKMNTKNRNSILDNLNKVKENLLKQKQELQEKQLEPEELKEKLKSLNEEIRDIEREILEAQIIEEEKEKQKLEEKNKANTKNEYNDEEKDGVIVSGSLIELIESNSKLENAKALKSTKATLKLELSYLETIENIDIAEDSYIAKQMKKLRHGISGLDKKINSEISKSNTNKVYNKEINIENQEENNTSNEKNDNNNKQLNIEA